ncbi:MAG: START domain-containing protein [Desulfobacteraceae bacterium]|nr:START domain-containing protein [Desulfobacteraceae bacterium]
MNNKFQRAVLGITVLVLFMAAPALAAGKISWKKWREADGIVGYEHSVADSKYQETKAVTVIDAPMGVLLEVLMDIPNFPKWMYQCKQATLLDKTDEFHRVLYYDQNIPVIGQPDRWAIIESITTYDLSKGSCTTTLNSIDRPYAKANGVRMNKFSGTFELTMLSRDKTQVSYTAFSDPAGFAPAFIANWIIRRVSFDTVQAWRQMAKDPHYIQAAQKGIPRSIIEKAIADGTLKYGSPTAG